MAACATRRSLGFSQQETLNLKACVCRASSSTAACATRRSSGALPLGVKALAAYPLKSSKRDPGLADVPVTFAGVRVSPGDWVYADGDGVLVAPEELKL